MTSQGKPQELTGDWSLTNRVLTLAQSGQGGALVDNVTQPAPERFTFRALDAGRDDPGLTFSRQGGQRGPALDP